MSNEVKCPKCGSDQITAQKKGFSAGKAVAGAVLTGGVGLLAGFHGSSDIEVVCLACGHTWNPKKLAEEKRREEVQKVNADWDEWKRSFYEAYEAKDFEKAERVYLSKNRFASNVPDVHEAYKFQKKGDRQMMVLWIILFILLAGIVYWIVS